MNASGSLTSTRRAAVRANSESVSGFLPSISWAAAETLVYSTTEERRPPGGRPNLRRTDKRAAMPGWHLEDVVMTSGSPGDDMVASPNLALSHLSC